VFLQAKKCRNYNFRGLKASWQYIKVTTDEASNVESLQNDPKFCKVGNLRAQKSSNQVCPIALEKASRHMTPITLER